MRIRSPGSPARGSNRSRQMMPTASKPSMTSRMPVTLSETLPVTANTTSARGG
jgi:hypothetical protein